MTIATKKLMYRLGVIGFGAFIVALGFLRQSQGEMVWSNWFGQPIWSSGVIVLGLFMIVVALIPSSWVAKVVRVEKRKPFRFRRGNSSDMGRR